MNPSKSNRSFRILHIILALTPTNGQYNEHCLPMRKIRDITICTFFKSEIIPPEEISLFDGDSTVRGFIRTLREALDAKEYDVVHVHTPHAGILLILTLLLSGLYSKMKPKSVHTIQNSWQNFKPRNQLMHLPSFYYFQYLVFCSHASYDSFPKLFKWLGRNRMFVVQNAVDLDRIDQITKGIATSPTNGQFNLSTIGLIKMKNPFTVLEAFRSNADPASKLVYMGEGNLRSKLTRDIELSGLREQVTLTGMIERDSVFEHFKKTDLFISASLGEGLPVAVMEAMACKCPVLLSDIPPHREVAQGADFIPLVKPDDVAGFAQEIHKFKLMSISEREAIGQKCREVIDRRFSLTTMHNGLAKIYSQITGSQIETL